MFECRSVSHHHTPLEIREQLSLTSAQRQDWLARHTNVVALSTCNRLELFAHVRSVAQMDELWADLLAVRGVTPGDVGAYATGAAGFEAADHLFRVSCGLESMALGEPQILGQVMRAYELAHGLHADGHALSLLFRAAIHTAKRARTETGIGNGSASVSSLGITRAEEMIGSLREKAILVLGAGEMGETIVKGLSQRGATNVTILSRTFASARQLAEAWGVMARPVTDLKEAMVQSDVLFATSGAPYTILGVEDIAPIMAARSARPLCVIDIALPRDVDPAVGQIPGVRLSDLDDLQCVIEQTLAEREANIPAVERIIEQELALFWNEYQARSVAPTIRKLREHAEELRQAELTWAYNKLAPESEHERALIEQFSYRLMNKMLHQVTRNLKAKASDDDGALVASVARDLFGLGD